MARAGRSSGNAEPAIKKRKRNSSPQERPHKVARMDSGVSVADLTLELSDGQKILDVLEESDSLGLLDRVFPTQAQSFSLRTLLAHSQQHSLRVLRSAIHNLRPLAAHPRSRPSETASQQRDFCELALSLLDQASRHIPLLSYTAPLPLDFLDEQKSSSPPDPSLSNHRYALVQHLPSGDYWSSLNSERPSSPPLFLKDLPTGHAELVSILPTPSSSQSSKPLPTLGSYKPTKSFTTKPLPAQRRLTAGSFLDYGPWASFAPSFDHDCELVGRHELGEVLWYKRERKAQNEVELREWIEGKGSIMDIDDETLHRTESEPIDAQAEFDGILLPEDIQNLKAALDNVKLENLVDELLTRNQRALVRLQELQIDRLSKQGALSTVDETSEEWQTAHGILESLETLTSLRPRTSRNGDFLSIIPPPSVLRKLHETLALEPHPGWHGTLPENRATALCDDSTVKVRAASAIPAQAAAAATATSTSSSPAPPSVTPVASGAVPATTPYAGYPYAYATQQAQAYRPAAGAVATTAYAPYKTGATSYYQNYIQNVQAQPQYYGQQAYGTGATGQQPYAAYSSWFAHAQQYVASAAAANSAATAAANAGRGTPQPIAATTATTTAAYGYYPPTAAGQQQQRPAAQGTGVNTTPAVANTAAMNKTTSGGASLSGVWGGYAMSQQPTLPARTAIATTTATAATPVATNGMYQSMPTQQNYYGAYQAPQQPAAQQSTASK